MAMAVSDGRSARREGNRLSVVDAVMSFFDEGVTEPSVEQITERSGVSERSIFRYFETLDDLRAAVVARVLERAAPLLELPDGVDLTLEERAAVFAHNRVAIYELIAGTARVARARELAVPAVGAYVEQFRSVLAKQVRQLFAPELAGRKRSEADQLVALLTSMLSFDGWDIQTRSLRRSSAQVRRAWAEAVTTLLRG